jgi:hypothetical protein
MILERTGDGHWYLKDTNVYGDTDVWLRMIEEADSDADDEAALSGA